MPKISVPSGHLKEVRHAYELENGWLKMPIEAIMFNPRLTGQARQLWTWLASMQFRKSDMSWTTCEYRMKCGTTSRRRALAQLQDEGFISVSSDGKTVTMHDPNEVYLRQKRLEADEICKECAELIKEEVVVEPVNNIVKKKPTKQTTKPSISDDKKAILEAWNSCKPDSFAKIRSVSDKQNQAVTKHLKNLGLDRKDIKEFICSVCRGLNLSDFWLTKVNSQTKNFNAVFGYGSPNDTKMKNIEQLYNDGDPSVVVEDTQKPVVYTEEQKDLIEEIEVHDYEIDMSFNDDERRQRSMKFRAQAVEKLKNLGIDLEAK